MAMHIKNYSCKYMDVTSRAFVIAKPRYVESSESLKRRVKRDHSDSILYAKHGELFVDFDTDSASVEEKEMDADRSSLLSVPFHHRDTKDVRNAILSFSCETHAAYVLGSMRSKVRKRAKIVGMELHEVIYHCTAMKMPLVLLLNSYCDVSDKTTMYDVYYRASISDF